MAMRIEPSALTPEILLRAYAIGLFPMAESAGDPHLFWVDPPLRGIFPLDAINISRSLAKAVRSDRFEVRIDHDFAATIGGCAAPVEGRPNTWINAPIRALYGALFRSGFVHTVEAYQDGRMAGGLYGVAIGAAFFGESMFQRRTDASKVCLAHLAARLRLADFALLDSQFLTPHLASLGAVEIARADYHARLAAAVRLARRFEARSLSGGEVLAALRPTG